MRYVARQRSVAISEDLGHCRVGIGPRGTGGFGLAVELRVALPGIERGLAQESWRTGAREDLPLLARHPRQRRGEHVSVV